MVEVNRSALVPYAASDMYRLVDDIEAYPEFLPWCASAIVHERSDHRVEASLELARAGLRRSFTTINTLVPYERIQLELVKGPFRSLSGSWYFDDLGPEGSKIRLELRFEFAEKLFGLIFGHMFEEACNTLVDSFCARAIQIYGSP